MQLHFNPNHSSEFQAVNDPAQPLSGLDWNAQERLWDKVAKEVLKALRIPIFNAAKSVTEPVPSTAASQISVDTCHSDRPVSRTTDSASDLGATTKSPSTEHELSDDERRFDTGDPLSAPDEYPLDPPRTHIKMRLEELVGLLSTENGKRKSVLKRIASALEMDITQFDENSAKKVISTYLLEAAGQNAIPQAWSVLKKSYAGKALADSRMTSRSAST